MYINEAFPMQSNSVSWDVIKRNRYFQSRSRKLDGKDSSNCCFSWNAVHRHSFGGPNDLLCDKIQKRGD